MDLVVISTLNGDFVAPCEITSLDGGVRMIEGLNVAGIEYVCLGNHEYDLGFAGLRRRLNGFDGQVINSNTYDELLADLPRYDTIQVGSRTVVLGGFLTEDKSIYAPSCTPAVTPISEACVTLWEEVKADLGKTPDVFLPMTHQLTKDDRATAASLAKHKELAKRTPVLLAGHDHEVFIEEVGKSLIVKVGADADNIGIVDIWWTAEGEMKRSCTLVPAEDFPMEIGGAAWVEKQRAFVKSMMSGHLVTVPTAMSSKRVRFEEQGVATFLLSLVKRAMASESVELVLLQGGGIRGGADYEAGPFTIGDLYKEFGFETPQAVIQLPGHIIAESIYNSRTAPKPAPNFLHVDGDAKVDQDHRLVQVDGMPFESERLYTVSIYQLLIAGLNVIQPLLSYVQEHVQVPSVEACQPVKILVLNFCMKENWRALLDVGDVQDPDELELLVDEKFADLDVDGDGVINQGDLLKFIESMVSDGKGGRIEKDLVMHMIRAIDADEDGTVSKDELMALVH
jgi:2',3'-cyclic-nucleotide 2'-phosphodiesterase (5'-nucleotidase family)